MENKQHPWRTEFNLRELAQIDHATAYARDHGDAGAPGHGQFLLIARLAKKLDDLEFAANNPITSTGETPE